MSTRRAASQAPRIPRPPRAPTPDSLREAALRHLARYAATSVRLLRVLDRRIDRWLRAAEDPDAGAAVAAEARHVARRVVAELAANGIVDDAAFAASRARSLLRTGRSQRQIAVHLAQRGIDAETLRETVPNDERRELAAALMLARKRRLGPYADGGDSDPAALRRAMGAFARAGFSHAVAMAALAMMRDEADTRIEALRRT